MMKYEEKKSGGERVAISIKSNILVENEQLRYTAIGLIMSKTMVYRRNYRNLKTLSPDYSASIFKISSILKNPNLDILHDTPCAWLVSVTKRWTCFPFSWVKTQKLKSWVIRPILLVQSPAIWAFGVLPIRCYFG